MALHITTLLAGVFFGMIFSQRTVQSEPDTSSIALAIENLQSDRGNVHVAVYDREESFAKSLKPFQLKIQKVSAGGRLHIQLDSLPHGRYALAVYHDENGNGDLDKNMLGIPKEPYGFSNNPRAKWSAPTYEETSFVLGAMRTSLAVSLKKWKER
ncbi:DUF2141 domain-containing protein [Flavilitoribacter nigricans]|uniref:DUF2141 domain-containing protein n=1 Tax=Flavilitoribacter nigricans (strain ATCC 23147 / DSM 23189 / NBRC 102662 / NCIMB 1420 / SS-2) TaxID=1122177 RepID=A0A2D0N871_FLAN2|nr:DUF2141 domain-containing protein [Flavilitoribacter nigricans]PHN04685.1 hypothetical protein CRP01_19400 [Flavilitoribacter nigricans DSM 23189 = NBRC 102662]